MEWLLHNIWLVAVLPIVAAVFITAFAKWLDTRAAYVGIGVMGLNLLWSIAILVLAISEAGGGHGHGGPLLNVQYADWAIFGNFHMPIGILVDNTTAIMLVVVTLVSTCVQFYSVGYMHGDKRYTRYYAAINLFTSGMLGLVLADNFFLLLISWEIMGLCSYLLIGHWYEREWPQMGSIKAFMTTRVGDMMMMVGIWMLYSATNSFKFDEITAAIPAVVRDFGPGFVILAGLMLFGGAVGKSAQFPLHTWLPDAMAGPTPGSALIHAATMVAAGVYLVSRSFDIMSQAGPTVMAVIAVIGAFTSFFAATIATIRSDVKEVLAYSTISQLGYMIMALGVGGYMAGVFHLMTHAAFKALLFLCAGSIIHAAGGVQDMHQMGGLKPKLPITYWTWLAGYAGLIGVPFIGAGFFSKDELLLAAYRWPEFLEHQFGLHLEGFWLNLMAWTPFVLATATAFLTAYYMTRATILVFHGKPRDKHLFEHAHESNAWMTIPLIVLAVPSLLAGWVQAPVFHIEWLHHFVGDIVEFGQAPEFSPLVMALAILMVVLAFGTAYAIYARNGGNVAWRTRAIRASGPLYTLVKNKYYVDEFYGVVFVRSAHALSGFVAAFDRYVIDAIVNGIGWLGEWFAWFSNEVDRLGVDGLVNGSAKVAMGFGRWLRRLSTGYVQGYMLTLAAVVVFAVFFFSVFSR